MHDNTQCLKSILKLTIRCHF